MKKITVEHKDGNIEFVIKEPGLTDVKEAQRVFNQALAQGLMDKLPLRVKLDEVVREQGLWSEEQEAKAKSLQKSLYDSERKLDEGGMKLSEAKQIAMQMKKDRDELTGLLTIRTGLDGLCAEGQADMARFNYLVYACTVNPTNNQRLFPSLDKFLMPPDERTRMLAGEAARAYANKMYNLDENSESTLPENRFLRKYKFVDEKLRLINENGHLVDWEGKLIDEEGHYVDENGNFIDYYGNPVDEEVEFKPFLDDDGNPVIVEETEEEVKSTPKRRGRRKKTEESVAEPKVDEGEAAES